MSKVIKIAFVVAFCLVLLIPTLTLRPTETYSDYENRTYSKFPTVFTKDGKVAPGLAKGLGHWYEDHIGLRNEMIGLSANMMVKGYGVSSSEKVSFGKDGWMFYTGDKNIEIGSGECRLAEAELRRIAQTQQMISDYYKSIGKEYFLLFTPSKASVYTEYMENGHEPVYTVMDQVADYLRENTDVMVINPKQAVIDAKSEGKLYLRTDTHWTQFGSYQAYKEILRQMKEYGTDLGEPVSVTFEDSTTQGEFSKMLGDPELLAPEASYKAVWDKKTELITSGDPAIDAIMEINSHTTYMSANTYQPELYRNADAQTDKKCLVYVDSMWAGGRGMPWYFSENFSELIYTRIRNVDYTIDSVYDSDVVIYSVGERFISVLTGMPANIPGIADLSYEAEISAASYREYPKFDFWTGRKGFCLDGETAEGLSISRNTANGLCTFKGWAVDFPQNSAATDVYVRVGGKTYKAIYGIERNGVVTMVGHEQMRFSGFEIRISPEELTAGDTVQFIMVNRDTGITYQPAEYKLVQ